MEVGRSMSTNSNEKTISYNASEMSNVIVYINKADSSATNASSKMSKFENIGNISDNSILIPLHQSLSKISTHIEEVNPWKQRLLEMQSILEQMLGEDEYLSSASKLMSGGYNKIEINMNGIKGYLYLPAGMESVEETLNKENKLEYVWATSWGVSTRLMGALIMAHSDDNGLVLPPKVAPIEVVIVPIYKTDDQQQAVLDYCSQMKQRLEAKGLRVKFDDRDTQKPGFKFAEWEMKGVPVRLAAGPRDVENQTVEIARRDTLTKQSISEAEMEDHILGLLDEIQDSLYNRALEYRKANTHRVDTWDEFKQVIENGGFAYAHWDGTTETELAIKEETKATLRCIPLDDDYEDGVDVFSGKPSKRRVIFAKAY